MAAAERKNMRVGRPRTEDENSTLKLGGPVPANLLSDSAAHLVVCLLSEGQNNPSHFLMTPGFSRAAARGVLLM